MGWANFEFGGLPIVLQSRHFPNLARGAGGVIWEVVDSVYGVPAVVGVGGLVDEEEFVDGLCDGSGWRLVFFVMGTFLGFVVVY
jgi:hypothetical protein